MASFVFIFSTCTQGIVLCISLHHCESSELIRVTFLAASCRLVVLGVDSNPHAFMTDGLFFNVIMA